MEFFRKKIITAAVLVFVSVVFTGCGKTAEPKQANTGVPNAQNIPAGQIDSNPTGTPTVDRSGGGDFGLLRSDFVLDGEHSAHAIGQNLEIFTKEGYRVNLILPPNNTLSQDVTIGALQKNPFPEKDVPNLVGTGVQVRPKYKGLSGRYFSDPAWLVFDFSPEKRIHSKKITRDFCRPDYKEFNVARCLNQTGGTLAHDSMYVMSIDTEGKLQARLAPIFRLGEDLYAVAVLYEGVYAPFVASAETKNNFVLFTEMTASTTRKEPTGLLEADRALRYFNLQPGEKMKAALAVLPESLEMDLLSQAMLLETAEHYEIADMETQARRFRFGRFSTNKWAEHMATIGLVKRSYPNTRALPDMFAPEVEKTLRGVFFKKNAKVADKISVLDTAFEMSKMSRWLRARPVGFNDTRSQLARLFVPSVHAEITPDWSDPTWFERFEKEVRKELCSLVDQTDDIESLMTLAAMATSDLYEAPECYDKAMKKAYDTIDKQIDAISPPAAGGSAGGGEPQCEVLIKKDLSNYGMNGCVAGSQAKLLDLASQAFKIEEEGLANKALQKAGL